MENKRVVLVPGDPSGTREVARLLDSGWRIADILHTSSVTDDPAAQSSTQGEPGDSAVRVTVVVLERIAM